MNRTVRFSAKIEVNPGELEPVDIEVTDLSAFVHAEANATVFVYDSEGNRLDADVRDRLLAAQEG